MIDTHTHIFDTAFDPDRAATIERATESGISRFILPAIDSESHESLIQSVRTFPSICFGAIGVHPTSVNDNEKWNEELEIVEKLLIEKPIEWVAIGEIGLDLYWSRDYFEQQLAAFDHQMQLAVQHNLPVIIHTRDAWDEMMQAIQPYAESARGVFHSFSGEQRHLDKILTMPGFYIGISGVVTYKKSTLPQLISDFPLDRIVLETDSPYLPPVPYRGKRNESSYLVHIAQQIAQIKQTSIENVKTSTTNNANRLFFDNKTSK